jgi:hypothetical protein
MSELPTARLHPRDAKERLAVVGAHARRGARRVPGIARWLWTCILGSVGVVYIVSRMIAWTSPPPRAEPPTVIHLGSAADELEIIDVPSPTGSGTIKSLARKRSRVVTPPPVTAVPSTP